MHVICNENVVLSRLRLESFLDNAVRQFRITQNSLSNAPPSIEFSWLLRHWTRESAMKRAPKKSRLSRSIPRNLLPTRCFFCHLINVCVCHRCTACRAKLSSSETSVCSRRGINRTAILIMARGRGLAASFAAMHRLQMSKREARDFPSVPFTCTLPPHKKKRQNWLCDI